MSDLPVKIITVDGPAASGKTTIGRMLADKLGFMFFDTGVMYRAVALAAYQAGVNPTDEEAVSALAEKITIDVKPVGAGDDRTSIVLLDGDDVSWAIREPVVDATVSKVSGYARVRAAMVAQQRKVGLRGKVVMIGRDIGTVVLPEADKKIYLEATLEVRARRRFQDLDSRGGDQSLEEVQAGLAARDEADTGRDLSPLRPAKDAFVIDTSELTPEETIRKIEPLLAG
ncbi:MAG: (d)CMP kinase [Anaerolineales bacterium]|nr:(d)CMP kinase [Anaerolineales bacterium]